MAEHNTSRRGQWRPAEHQECGNGEKGWGRGGQQRSREQMRYSSEATCACDSPLHPETAASPAPEPLRAPQHTGQQEETGSRCWKGSASQRAGRWADRQTGVGEAWGSPGSGSSGPHRRGWQAPGPKEICVGRKKPRSTDGLFLVRREPCKAEAEVEDPHGSGELEPAQQSRPEPRARPAGKDRGTEGSRWWPAGLRSGASACSSLTSGWLTQVHLGRAQRLPAAPT